MICICFKFISVFRLLFFVGSYFIFRHEDFHLILFTALFVDWEPMRTFVWCTTIIWIAFGSELTSKVLRPAWKFSSEIEVYDREHDSRR